MINCYICRQNLVNKSRRYWTPDCKWTENPAEAQIFTDPSVAYKLLDDWGYISSDITQVVYFVLERENT